MALCHFFQGEAGGYFADVQRSSLHKGVNVVKAVGSCPRLEIRGLSLLPGKEEYPDSLTALLVGLALMTAVAGWLLPFPIHHRWLYFVVALVILVIRAQAIGALLATSGRSLLSATTASPLVAFIVFNLIGLCSTPSWLPTMQADDISYHLALPFQLQDLGYYRT